MSQYIWVGLLAAVPLAIVILVLALRGYDIDLNLRRKDRSEKHSKDEE